jgi:RNA polymerase sigma-70 factor (ECF subfamily)
LYATAWFRHAVALKVSLHGTRGSSRELTEIDRRNNVSVAALSHTQRMSSNSPFRSFSPTPSVAGEKTESELALVCREGVAVMDITDEEEAALEDSVRYARTTTQIFVPDERTERLLDLFRAVNASDKEDVSVRQGINADAHERILALYKEYRPRLFKYIRSLNVKREAAEELVQETFLQLANALRRGVDIANVTGWIIRVGHHLAVDVIKEEMRDQERHREITEVELDTVVDGMASPEEIVLKKEQRRRMDMALSQFKPQHRQCFYLRTQGFRYKDIGEALGISEQRAALIVKQVTHRLAVLCG